MARGRLYIAGDAVRSRRAFSVPAEEARSPVVDSTALNKALFISSHAVQDTDALTAASRRHDRDFLHDVSNKLATASLAPPRPQDPLPVYIGGRYPAVAPPPANLASVADYRRRTWYAPPVSDDEVAAYMAGGPSGRPYIRQTRGASLPPPVYGPSVPRWHPPSSTYGRGGSVPPRSLGYSRSSLAPYEDVVVGVAHTSLYGDIVIGIPYNKRHMFDTEKQTNHVGSSGYGYRPTYGSRNSIATNNPYLGASTVSVTPNYRRASVATPYRRNPYEDLDDLSTLPSTHYHHHPTAKLSHYEDEDYDLPRRGPALFSGLRNRAQSAQRQLEGIPEFHAAPSRAVSSAPSFRAPYANYYGGTAAPTAGAGYSPAPSYGPNAPAGSPGSRLPPKANKLPVSEARRKVRDLLCKSKNDPRYFED